MAISINGPWGFQRDKGNLTFKALRYLIRQLGLLHIRIIQGFTKAFIEDFTPNQTWVISLTEIEGYDKPLIEYTTWDEEKDGPIPGIKLFKHLNIFLEREYCEY